MTYFAIGIALILALVIVRLVSQHREERETWESREQSLIKKAQRSESSHHREIRRLLDALPDPFFSISQDRKFIRLNTPAAELFKNRDLHGRSIRQIFLDADILEIIDESFESSSRLSRTVILSPNSSFSTQQKTSHWAIEVHPVSLQTDQIEIQLMMRDITGSVIADQVRQDFIANASHELRTPLSIISGYLENLTEKDGLDQKPIAKKMLGTMSQHVDRINRIVDDMLMISRLESAKEGKLRIENFKLSDCVRDIADRLDLVIKNQKATITEDLSDITLNGDFYYWTQLLFNLVENALKQNPNTPIEIKISALQNKHNTVITITDNGIGIPRGDLAFIFKRFYRVEKDHSQNKVKGTGLGLSIVKRAVEAHGGNITVSSSPGVETTFTIETPVKKTK